MPARYRFSIARATAWRYVVLLVLTVLMSGCESINIAQLFNIETSSDRVRMSQEEESKRAEYLADGSPQALRWLLAHRIENGMTVSDIDSVLGQEGIREFNDSWLKTHGGFLQSGDHLYKWGPDAKGQSVYLGFREGTLVHFDPSEYE